MSIVWNGREITPFDHWQCIGVVIFESIVNKIKIRWYYFQHSIHAIQKYMTVKNTFIEILHLQNIIEYKMVNMVNSILHYDTV